MLDTRDLFRVATDLCDVPATSLDRRRMPNGHFDLIEVAHEVGHVLASTKRQRGLSNFGVDKHHTECVGDPCVREIAAMIMEQWIVMGTDAYAKASKSIAAKLDPFGRVEYASWMTRPGYWQKAYALIAARRIRAYDLTDTTRLERTVRRVLETT